MSLKLIVVAEAKEDFETAIELADRVLLEKVDWLDEELLPYQREWIVESEGTLLTWGWVARRSSELGLSVTQGFIADEPCRPDAQAFRRAMRYIREQFEAFDGVVFLRDMDKQLERCHGLHQGRSEERSERVIIIGCAIVVRECWILCGFDPRSAKEEELLEQERRQLGFPPQLRSHELTSGKSAKRVCAVLTDNNLDRQRDCWNRTALTLLRERGRENGLNDYLVEVEERLVPLFVR